MRKISSVLFLVFCVGFVQAQNIMNNPTSNHGNKFEQLGTILPTPNEYRTASGAPGSKYWQQRADYDITCTLDEKTQKLTGIETVTYFNNSPDVLTYIWLQLDENEHSTINNANYQDASFLNNNKAISANSLKNMADEKKDNGYGFQIAKLTEAITGKALKYTVNKTMMRVELPTPLKPGMQFKFVCSWSYKISDRMAMGGRGGYEYFAEEGNHIFTMAQWYPRLCVYSDFQGWQNHQFTGRGEFALTFGNYKVAMTVPADHVVLSTGEGQNFAQVLTPTQLKRWQQAQTAKDVVEIVTLDEAKAAEKNANKTATKTWIFKADNVRDFAWGSSRKFVWDAMPTFVEGKKVMCMSGYAKEAYNLYRKYSTKAVAHTIKSYSKFSIPYPYPVAQSLEASNGMEYPMICFNYGRTEKDGTYSESVKYGMLGVIIHEVGHNFFPMIINSDERQWSWMDEGLNTFVQYLSEELWDNKYPTRSGPAFGITNYMKLPKEQLEPIMTNSENIVQFGPNAYSKPATGLNILRETVMGRELFDYAFKEYARRWAFKHPTPADLFRTMEDASAEDLDWFWRGWFYGIDACDIAIDTVKHAIVDVNAAPPSVNGRTSNVGIAKPQLNIFEDIAKIRNREDKSIVFAVDADTSLRDFYWRYARGLEPYDTAKYTMTIPAFTADALSEEEKKQFADTHLYEITFSNKGGLVMPIIVEFSFADGTKQVEKIPAQIWRKNENKVTKVFMTTKKATGIKLDPMKETADINEANNTWGKVDEEPSKFSAYKTGAANRRNPAPTSKNPMQAAAAKGK
jgi:Peptidase family M1 domain